MASPKREVQRGECAPKSVPASLRTCSFSSSRVGGTARSSATPSAGAPSRYTPSPSGMAPNRSWVLRTSATTEAIVSGEAVSSTSASSVSTRLGSPGKPTPSSLRTVLRPPSQPTR